MYKISINIKEKDEKVQIKLSAPKDNEKSSKLEIGTGTILFGKISELLKNLEKEGN